MEQCLEKFLLLNSIMCIDNFLYNLFHIRCGLGTGVLFLLDRIRDNHVVYSAVKETCHHNDRDCGGNHQNQCEFGAELHVTISQPESL